MDLYLTYLSVFVKIVSFLCLYIDIFLYIVLYWDAEAYTNYSCPRGIYWLICMCDFFIQCIDEFFLNFAIEVIKKYLIGDAFTKNSSNYNASVEELNTSHVLSTSEIMIIKYLNILMLQVADMLSFNEHS